MQAKLSISCGVCGPERPSLWPHRKGAAWAAAPGRVSGPEPPDSSDCASGSGGRSARDTAFSRRLPGQGGGRPALPARNGNRWPRVPRDARRRWGCPTCARFAAPAAARRTRPHPARATAAGLQRRAAPGGREQRTAACCGQRRAAMRRAARACSRSGCPECAQGRDRSFQCGHCSYRGVRQPTRRASRMGTESVRVLDDRLAPWIRICQRVADVYCRWRRRLKSVRSSGGVYGLYLSLQLLVFVVV